jgi:nicotinamidase/pyrazinamidase
MAENIYDEHTALIVVDMQNDFADPGGSLYVKDGEKIINYINQQIDKALAASAVVVYTQDWHPPSTPHFAKDGGIWPAHCVAGTWGADFVQGLKVVDAPIIKKGSGGEDGYSGFTVKDPISGKTTPTELNDLLRKRGISKIVVVGLATDYCVKATAIDGAKLGFKVKVLLDATRAVNLQPGDEEKAVLEMRRSGVEVE